MPDQDEDHARSRRATSAAVREPDRPRGGEPDRPRSGEADIAHARRAVATFGGEHPPGSFAQGLRAFVRKYGWRAYALPILVIVTAAALLTAQTSGGSHNNPGADSGGPGNSGSQPPPLARDHTTLKADAPGDNAHDTALKSAALPAGPKYPMKGDGTFRILKGSSTAVGSGQSFRYSIEVENGITGINLKQYARMVQTTLADSRSWSGHGVSVQRVDSGQIDFHVSLTSALTVRTLCGYDIPIETSCYIRAGDASPVNRVVFDDARWVRGSAAYVGDLNAYRIYMINHEDGHAMGHQHAHECLPNGLAPAMMQQTIGTKDPHTDEICQANPWPYPPGVKGAPGAEQRDTVHNSEFQINGD